MTLVHIAKLSVEQVEALIIELKKKEIKYKSDIHQTAVGSLIVYGIKILGISFGSVIFLEFSCLFFLLILF